MWVWRSRVPDGRMLTGGGPLQLLWGLPNSLGGNGETKYSVYYNDKPTRHYDPAVSTDVSQTFHPAHCFKGDRHHILSEGFSCEIRDIELSPDCNMKTRVWRSHCLIEENQKMCLMHVLLNFTHILFCIRWFRPFKVCWLPYAPPNLTIKWLCILPTEYLYVPYVSQNKKRLIP